VRTSEALPARKSVCSHRVPPLPNRGPNSRAEARHYEYRTKRREIPRFARNDDHGNGKGKDKGIGNGENWRKTKDGGIDPPLH
jgi:hypothetical protein